MHSIITLTTDFGLSDAYVACVKGIILRINPDATIIDISHSIEPQNVLQGAFILHTAHKYFPQSTIHIAVVDPGVGSGRKAIIFKTPSAFFLAPDNGLLSYVVDELYPLPAAKPSAKLGILQEENVGDKVEVFAITNSLYWRQPVSATFHGRDIFAPVAAHLSRGIPPSQLGERIDRIHVFPLSWPYKDSRGNLTGQVVHIDGFGNLITNIREKDLIGMKIVVEINKQLIHGSSRFYQETEGLSVITGSFGYLEISFSGSNAAVFLKAKIGDKVKVKTNPG
jgi:S-adenosylmethionine hydrolase